MWKHGSAIACLVLSFGAWAAIATPRADELRSLGYDSQVEVDVLPGGGFTGKVIVTGVGTGSSLKLLPARFGPNAPAESALCSPDRSLCVRAQFECEPSSEWVDVSWQLLRNEEILESNHVRMRLSAAEPR